MSKEVKTLTPLAMDWGKSGQYVLVPKTPMTERQKVRQLRKAVYAIYEKWEVELRQKQGLENRET